MATRIMELVSRLDKAGRINIVETELGLAIPKRALSAAVAGAALPLPALSSLEDSLISAGFLVDKDDNAWVVSRQVWSFYASAVV
jgi:hypothetical protein